MVKRWANRRQMTNIKWHDTIQWSGDFHLKQVKEPTYMQHTSASTCVMLWKHTLLLLICRCEICTLLPSHNPRNLKFSAKIIYTCTVWITISIQFFFFIELIRGLFSREKKEEHLLAWQKSSNACTVRGGVSPTVRDRGKCSWPNVHSPTPPSPTACTERVKGEGFIHILRTGTLTHKHTALKLEFMLDRIQISTHTNTPPVARVNECTHKHL